MEPNVIENFTTVYQNLEAAVDEAQELYNNAQTQVKSTEEALRQSYRELMRLNEINKAAVAAHEQATQIESKQKELYEAAKTEFEEVKNKLRKLIGAPAQGDASGEAPEVGALPKPDKRRREESNTPEQKKFQRLRPVSSSNSDSDSD